MKEEKKKKRKEERNFTRIDQFLRLNVNEKGDKRRSCHLSSNTRINLLTIDQKRSSMLYQGQYVKR